MTAQNITLTTSDGANIEVERQVLECSTLIKSLLAADSGQAPILNINEQVTRKVVEWCERQKKDRPVSAIDDSDSRNKCTDSDGWDQKFMQVDQEMLFEIIVAADYLGIKALLDDACKTVANTIKGKSPKEIKHYSQDRLLSLRPELHVMILEQLESDVDMMAFASTSATLCRVLASDLYRRSSVLQFLDYAKRPLTVAEVVDILAVKADRPPSFDSTNRMHDPERVLKLFPNVLTIDGNEVRLAPFVNKLVLRENRSEPRAHVTITRVLLAYLSSLSEGEDDDYSILEEYFQASFPLAQYASEHWMEHARIAEKEDEDEAVRQQILDFCLNREDPWRIFMDFFDADHLTDHAKTAGWNEFIRPSPLYMTSMGNMPRTVKGLLEKGQDPDEDCGVLGGALFAACEAGSEEIVELLLDYGADVNRPGHHPDGGDPASALTVAIENRHNASAKQNPHDQLVKLLIDRGANPDLPGSYIPNDTFVSAVSILPTHLASFRGYDRMTEAILKAGTQSFNVVHEFEGTALRAILCKVRIDSDWARSKLDKASNETMRDEAVHDLNDAMDESRMRIVKMLLEHGADVNIQGHDKETDFHAACTYRHEAYAYRHMHMHKWHEDIDEWDKRIFDWWDRTVLVLIEHGKVDLEASHGFLGDALQTISFCGYTKAVDLLLRKGADPTTCTSLAAFNPSQKDVREVLADLQLIHLDSGKTLPPELALSILSIGYNPRVVTHAIEAKRYSANNFWRPGPRASVAGLYLSTECIPGVDSSLGFSRVIPQRIVFQVAAEQGSVPRGGEGTRGNWCVFFEVSILRPIRDKPLPLEDLLRDTWETPLHARDALKKRGWEFLNEGKEVIWRMCNIGTGDDCGNCTVEWIRGCTPVADDNRVGGGEGFLELLQSGYVVALWARAVGHCREMTVEAAKVDIEYELR